MDFRKMKALIITLLLMFASEASAAKGRLEAFGGIPFGTSLTKTLKILRAKYPQVDHWNASYGSAVRVINVRFDGKNKANVYYYFDSDGLKKAAIEPTDPNLTKAADLLKTFFERKHGKPSWSSENEIHVGALRFAQTYVFTNYQWNFQSGKLMVEHVKTSGPRKIEVQGQYLRDAR